MITHTAEAHSSSKQSRSGEEHSKHKRINLCEENQSPHFECNVRFEKIYQNCNKSLRCYGGIVYQNVQNVGLSFLRLKSEVKVLNERLIYDNGERICSCYNKSKALSVGLHIEQRKYEELRIAFFFFNDPEECLYGVYFRKCIIFVNMVGW